jgi:hypothetical protein
VAFMPVANVPLSGGTLLPTNEVRASLWASPYLVHRRLWHDDARRVAGGVHLINAVDARPVACGAARRALAADLERWPLQPLPCSGSACAANRHGSSVRQDVIRRGPRQGTLGQSVREAPGGVDVVVDRALGWPAYAHVPSRALET